MYCNGFLNSRWTKLHMLSEFAEEIRKLCTDNGVEMIAYVG